MSAAAKKDPGKYPTYLLDRCELKGSHTLKVAREQGVYETLKKVLEDPVSPAEVTQIVKDSGLRGRGGAGFPCGLKWTFMPDPEKDPRPRFLAVNADESEPGTCKDRVLMADDPHGLIEGCLLSAYAMRVPTVYIYVRGEYRFPYDRVQAAIDEAREANLVGQGILGSDFDCEIWMHKGAGAYICGEEMGLMESLEGKRGHPRPKPPFPAGAGLWRNPTTVNNIETLFNVPFILARGAEWYRGMGTEKSTGNFLCGISGHIERPGIYEVPFGVTVSEIIDDLAGGVWKGRALKAFLPGGSSSGFLPASLVDTRMEHDALAAVGSMIGTGAIIAMDETVNIAHASSVVARFYEHESCGQCSQCREGTQWLHQIFERIAQGRGLPGDADAIGSLAHQMAPGRTICALSDAAAIPAWTAVENFREEFDELIRGASPEAADMTTPDVPDPTPPAAPQASPA